ncbi:MAG: hypothetical protein ACFCUR_13670 [Rhodomicrobiaceae bacterium]
MFHQDTPILPSTRIIAKILAESQDFCPKKVYCASIQAPNVVFCAERDPVRLLSFFQQTGGFPAIGG